MNKIERIRDLVDQLNQYRHEYYNLSDSSVSDAVYDRLFDELAKLEKETGIVLSNSPTNTVGYSVVSKLPTLWHPIPLLSLDKTKRMDNLIRFRDQRDVLLMYKLDGLTVKLEYKAGRLLRASTRGNGDVGEDVTHNVYAFKNVPIQIPYDKPLVVVGEAVIHLDDFVRLQKILLDSSGNPYRNARNLAAGSVRSLDANKCAERSVQFHAFNVLEGFSELADCSDSKHKKLHMLENLGITICDHVQITENRTSSELQLMIDELQRQAAAKKIPIDGMVLTFDSISFSNACGRTGHHYKDGLAFKFEDNLFETVLRVVEWNTTRFGEIAPVAVFDPVEIDGCIVSRATLHNLNFIKKLKLGIGDRILISKRNMIIPQVEDNLDRSGTLEIPSMCSCCGLPTEKVMGRKADTEMLFCNNANCPAKHIRRFIHFVSKKAMDIDGLSEAILTEFIGRGWLQSYPDLYCLDQHADEIKSMEGFGEKSYSRLWNSIQKSRNVDFPHFLCAMDIPMIGSTASRTLSNVFQNNIDLFMLAVDTGYDFTTIADFGETLHKNIYDWFAQPANRKTLEEMKEKVTFMTDINTFNKNESNPFTGKTVVVTGTLENFTRDSVNNKLTSLGAKAGSSVSKKTDYVLAGEKAGSKREKAAKLGIPILSEAEFLVMIGEI